MVQFIFGAIALISLAFFVIRRIIKLPSRYERKPQVLSPWNSLDHGIDPSIPKERET